MKFSLNSRVVPLRSNVVYSTVSTGTGDVSLPVRGDITEYCVPLPGWTETGSTRSKRRTIQSWVFLRRTPHVQEGIGTLTTCVCTKWSKDSSEVEVMLQLCINFLKVIILRIIKINCFP